MKKAIIYCIPGLGLNHKVFKKLHIPSAELRFLDFIEPNEGENISEYARRLSDSITEKHFSLLGMSLGGILSVEISRLKNVDQLFLISTVKNKMEMPSILKYMDKLPTSNKRAAKLAIDASITFKPYYDKSDEEGSKLFQEMINATSHTFLNWAMKEISNWSFNDKVNCPFYHIHGTSDLVFPLKNIDKAESLKKGTHYMIYNNAAEISERIENKLNNNI